MLAHPIIEFWVELPTHEAQPAAAVRQKVAPVRPNHSVGVVQLLDPVRAVADLRSRQTP